MTNDQITRLRLQNQNAYGGNLSVRELVSHLGAVQAQDYYSALWAIGLRTGNTQREVIESVERGEIVRTWSQRGTIHFVPAEDALWMVNLSARRMLQSVTKRHDDLGLDAKTLEKSTELFGEALSERKRLTRPQMMGLLTAAGISTANNCGYQILWHAAQSGQIYIGPMDGKQQTFGLLSDLPVSPRELGRDEAICELVKRYFTSHGPATIHDFAWWAGLTLAETKGGLAESKGSLGSEIIDGTEYWMAVHQPPKDPPNILLLPGFDEYILGYKDRSAQMKAEYFPKIVPGRNGIFMPTVVEAGQVVGVWKRTVNKGRLMVELSSFEPPARIDEQAIESAKRAYASYLEMDLVTL